VSLPESTSSGLVLSVRRFATLVVLAAILCAGAAAALSYRSAVSYAADATYLVPPGASSTTTDALTPYDAERVARTYAVVLSEDEQLLEAVAEGMGQSRRHVADRVSAVALPNSSAVRVSYRADSRAEVRSFFAELTEQATTASPPTPNLRADTLTLLRSPDEIPASGGDWWIAAVAGALAGLLLGLGAASWLGRALPRVYTAADLRVADGPSVLDVDLGRDAAVDALAVRLIDGMPEGAWIAVLAATPESAATAEDLSGRLALAVQRLIAEGTLHEATGAARWIPTALGAGGERTAQDAERTLLVVPRGTDLRTVAARMSDLRDLGAADVVVSVTRSSRRARSRTAPDATRARALGPAEST
jgi:hypothetical protein